MTKEEAIKIIETAQGADGYIMDGWEDAIEMALDALVREANVPEPQGLDEAATAHLSTVEGKEAWSYGPDHYDGKDVEDSFKAGAKWMEEQGEEAEVGYWNQTGLSIRLDKALERLGYEDGDKVIVQIRKVNGKRNE